MVKVFSKVTLVLNFRIGPLLHLQTLAGFILFNAHLLCLLRLLELLGCDQVQVSRHPQGREEYNKDIDAFA